MKRETAANFIKGAKHGLPIGLGYFAVSFSLGITARNAGLTPFQGLMISLLNNASAGEYAGIAAIRTGAPYLELVFLILIANARYFLMSCALSQRLSPKTSLGHRLLIGFDITDEIFGIGVTHPYPLPPRYMYGAFLTTIPMWALGTMFGVIAGNILPAVAVTALSAAIYGMFIAVVIPPARDDRTLLVLVVLSFAISWGTSLIPLLSQMSESLRIILLTLIISGTAALIRPIRDEQEGEG